MMTSQNCAWCGGDLSNGRRVGDMHEGCHEAYNEQAVPCDWGVDDYNVFEENCIAEDMAMGECDDYYGECDEDYCDYDY